jgi:hypothetical protein
MSGFSDESDRPSPSGDRVAIDVDAGDAFARVAIAGEIDLGTVGRITRRSSGCASSARSAISSRICAHHVH